VLLPRREFVPVSLNDIVHGAGGYTHAPKQWVYKARLVDKWGFLAKTVLILERLKRRIHHQPAAKPGNQKKRKLSKLTDKAVNLLSMLGAFGQAHMFTIMKQSQRGVHVIHVLVLITNFYLGLCMQCI